MIYAIQDEPALAGAIRGIGDDDAAIERLCDRLAAHPGVVRARERALAYVNDARGVLDGRAGRRRSTLAAVGRRRRRGSVRVNRDALVALLATPDPLRAAELAGVAPGGVVTYSRTPVPADWFVDTAAEQPVPAHRAAHAAGTGQRRRRRATARACPPRRPSIG